MEEDKKVEQNDKLKRVVEDTAKKDSKLDKNTAVVNKENKIVDIEDVLANADNKLISIKIDNLNKFGFGLNYIRQLISKDSSFSVGDLEEDLANELDKITNLVIKTISEKMNGIVLNLDGSLNEKASNRQQKEIDKANDVYFKTHMRSTESIDQIYDTILETLNSKNYDFLKEDNEYKNLKEEDFKNITNIMYSNNNIENVINSQLSEAGKKRDEEVNKKGFYNNYEQFIIAESFMKYKANIKLRNLSKQQAFETLILELNGYLEPGRAEIVLKAEFGFTEEIRKENIDKLLDFAEELQHMKNEKDTARELKRYSSQIDTLDKFNSLSEIDRKTILINIAKGYYHPDNEKIRKLYKSLRKEFRNKT